MMVLIADLHVFRVYLHRRLKRPRELTGSRVGLWCDHGGFGVTGYSFLGSGGSGP